MTKIEDASVERAQALTDSTARPHAADAQWVDLLVVDQDGAPVAGAEVHWRDPKAFDDNFCDTSRTWQQRTIVWNRPLELARLFGWTTRTDPEGRARVTIGDGFVVTGRTARMFGLLEILPNMKPPPDGFRLVLLPELAVDVLVLDSNDQPCAQVPLKILATDESGKETRSLDGRAMALTDEHGRATLANLQMQQDRLSEDNNVPIGMVRTFVNLALPGHTNPGVEIDLTHPPAEPVVLRMPPTGSVRVRVELPGLANAKIKDVTILGAGEDYDGELHKRPGPDGWALFPHVPIGQRLLASSKVCDRLHVAFDGPKFRNDRVDLRLAPPPNHITLTARILTPQGTPIANTYLRLQLDGQSVASLKTNESGHALISWQPEGEAAEIKFGTARIRNGIKGEAPGEALLQLDTLARGVTHLGDVVMRRHPLAVSGQILCGTAPSKKRLYPDLQRFQPEADAGDEPWVDVPQTMLDLTTDGRFAIYAKRKPGRYRLSIDSWDTYPIKPIPIELGDKGLVVQIELGHSLHVSAWIPNNANASDLRVEAQPEGRLLAGSPEHSLNSSCFERKLGEQCTASLQAIPAGRYSLHIKLEDTEEALVLLKGIEIPQPDPSDPRLANIDLRNKLKLTTIRCFDPSGKPIEQTGMLFRSEDENKDDAPYRWLEGKRTQLVMPTGELDHVAILYGYQARRLRGPGPQFDLTMHPWHQAELSLPSGLDLPPNCVPLLIVTPRHPLPNPMTPRDDEDRLPQDRMRRIPHTLLVNYHFGEGVVLPFGKGGKVELALSPGTHDVKLLLLRHGASGADSAVTVAGVEPAQIGGNASRNVLRIPQTSWRAALTRLKL